MGWLAESLPACVPACLSLLQLDFLDVSANQEFPGMFSHIVCVSECLHAAPTTTTASAAATAAQEGYCSAPASPRCSHMVDREEGGKGAGVVIVSIAPRS